MLDLYTDVLLDESGYRNFRRHGAKFERACEGLVVVGHTECGGANACYAAVKRAEEGQGPAVAEPHLPVDAPLNKWLAPLTSLAGSLKLGTVPSEVAVPALVEENVRVQVEHICNTSVIQDAWAKKEGKPVWVHGWVFDIANGKIKDLEISRGPSIH
ncbi:hypothetical protein FISHEDRAFT_76446 [Fistulina hepatica ATCC 64428]|uniref:Carbonic anhydrase n=1 Tax=Fistulina hepatica ATCC 64428 TaxID=1128425 RepID=A0A0D7A5D9_9AGAR|nr:hypothetical protein FISHEDRAFT_76446 [Fistulina hepatica ATCC 64428]